MSESAAVTVRSLAEAKAAGRPITMLTCYDAAYARRLDAAGVDCLLVGDSLGNVIQGHRTTVPVGLEDMVYHTRAVARGTGRALLIADMPFLSYHDRTSTMASARALLQAGAAMVKLEGAGEVIDRVAELAGQGVSVCAHLGLTPQRVHRLGGFRVQARESGPAEKLRNDARALADAGAQMLVLECVPAALAARVARDIPIPVIGIGAGAEVDGQVLVLYDALGITPGRRPRFVRDFAAGRDLDEAIAAYIRAVADRSFPAPGESFE